jgi:hypothetical protein
MKRSLAIFVLGGTLLMGSELPRGRSGAGVHYRLASPASKASMVSSFTLQYEGNWLGLDAAKQDGTGFRLWVQRPEAPERYILREGSGPAREYRHAQTGAAVPPTAVGLSRLLPQTIDGGGTDVTYLGHRYVRAREQDAPWSLPGEIVTVALRPDMLVGPASNARPKDDTRRWDGSDYEMVRFTEADYRTLASAGVNCVRTDDAQAAWADSLGLFYWGAGAKLPYPEMLYRSQYLGPALFLDEPAVSTRDHVLRPRLAKEEAFRKSIRPREALAAFESYYDNTLATGAPARLRAMLAARPDIDLGSFAPVQENLYSWETMISTAAWQLSRQPGVPEAFVFEPPGRIGSRRTLPELNMTAGTQFASGDTRALADSIFAFLRGAARLSGKNWGVSIYGAVERADSFGWLTRAYDMGATRFHFWDNYQLACVPFREYLELARHLRDHAANHPPRDLERLKRAAEVAITLPPGYDLGHTQMGRGNLWGLAELNLERRNQARVPYRTVMANFWREVERSLGRGIPFDALWDLPGKQPQGYREVVRVREDGRVQVESGGKQLLLAGARRADPKPGEAPQLALKVHGSAGNFTATARIRETTAPVWYTHGTDDQGIYRNAMVLWELFGPAEEDYRNLAPERLQPVVRRQAAGAEVDISFRLERPGRYRLRAATVDTVGRSRVVWQALEVSPAGELTAGSAPRTAPPAPAAPPGRRRAGSPPPGSDPR